ncbi:MAG: phage tail protein [Terriglobia bacterium]
MSNPFLGEIRIFGFTFAPTGWAQCNGALLSISQNTALFSILGTTYGGDGRTTFGLPDLQGDLVAGAGSGPGLTPRSPGDTGGETTVTIATATMAAHTHAANCNSGAGNQTNPAGSFWAQEAGGTNAYSGSGPAQMAAAALSPSGSAAPQPHANLQPFLVLNYCIALQGVYPSRT